MLNVCLSGVIISWWGPLAVLVQQAQSGDIITVLGGLQWVICASEGLDSDDCRQPVGKTGTISVTRVRVATQIVPAKCISQFDTGSVVHTMDQTHKPQFRC